MSIEVLENTRKTNRVRAIVELLNNGYYEEPYMIVVSDGTNDGICDGDSLYEGEDAIFEFTLDQPYATEIAYVEDILEAISNGANMCLPCGLLHEYPYQIKNALAKSDSDYHLIINGDIGWFKSGCYDNRLPNLDPTIFYHFGGGATIVTETYKDTELEKYFDLFGFKPFLDGSLYID